MTAWNAVLKCKPMGLEESVLYRKKEILCKELKKLLSRSNDNIQEGWCYGYVSRELGVQVPRPNDTLFSHGSQLRDWQDVGSEVWNGTGSPAKE